MSVLGSVTLAARSVRLEPAPSGLHIEERRGSFVVSFGRTVRACSWAIVHGGLVDADSVVWLEVHDRDLGPAVDARAFLGAHLRREGLARAVGLLTSRRVSSHARCAAQDAGVTAHAVATVGLGNALRAGDSSRAGPRFGTINLLVHVEAPLTDEGLLEASAIATEAKSAAMFDARIASRTSGRLATGTGTDCTVVTCPLTARAEHRLPYAGKHTAVGGAVGAAAERAVAAGIRQWRRDVGA
jgi:adenosylcobinamide amidohydrolase